MGHKLLKEHYQIKHIVCVTDQGICIGSQYIHDLIIVGFDGTIIKSNDGRSNEELKRYMAEMKADPVKLREIVQAVDIFKESIPVYTYNEDNIIEKFCEKPGWPNVTHDGDLMYENEYSTTKSKVVRWAKESAKYRIKLLMQTIEEMQAELTNKKVLLKKTKDNLAKLNAEYN